MTGPRSSGWRRVEEALALYGERLGAPAPFWLRDDDAVAPSAALDRLLGIADRTGVPVSLAVIPALSEASLRPYLDARSTVAVLQHGWSHANHAPQAEKKCEFGTGRDPAEMAAEITAGRERLAAFAGFVPIFVPPWNRISSQFVQVLSGLGFAALSTFGERSARQAAPGLAALNTQIDPVDWRGGRRFLGVEPVLAAIAGRLERLARGEAVAGEPTGLLTHHLVHDAQTYAFLGDLLEFLAGSGLVQWVSGAVLLERFGLGQRVVTE